MAEKKQGERQRNPTHILSYLMKIDQSIRNGEYPNCNKLNKENGWSLSRSTLGRYINILRDDYRAPVEYDFQKNGYYYTDNTFYLKQVMLNEGELLTLSTILPLLEQYKNTPMEKTFRNLMIKLIQMLPDSITVDSALINDEVHFISDPITRLEAGTFDSILKATKSHCTLQMNYKAAQNTDYQERKFDPYHIICQKGSWYVLGLSHHSKAIRLYAMPRIKNCQVTKEKFTIPKDFKLENHLDLQMGAWGNSNSKIKVELQFIKELKTYVMERSWHNGQIMKENSDGTVYLSFETNQLGQVASWVLSFGGRARVLNPPELKKEVEISATRILSESL